MDNTAGNTDTNTDSASLDPTSLGHMDLGVHDYMSAQHTDDYMSSMASDFIDKSYKRKRTDADTNPRNKLQDTTGLGAKFMIASAPQSPVNNDKIVEPARRNSSAEGLLSRNGQARAGPVPASSEPITEVIDGVEWVSFIYSHNRQLKQYKIRTDIDTIDLDELNEQFKNENCVYPRAYTTQEQYQGNRWTYETECNNLGWKLAALNTAEIGAKRGLIQRAVDSYRNRYPQLRSRRVARQEKLIKGTLRKRKSSRALDLMSGIGGDKDDEFDGKRRNSTSWKPKTLVFEDVSKNNAKCRIKINVEDVRLDDIDVSFKQHNCVFPRANVADEHAYVGNNYEAEKKCNELAWKLAWLNPKVLANNRALLQRAVDSYRSKFTEDLKPRKAKQRNNAKDEVPGMQQQPLQPNGNILASHPIPSMHPQQHLLPGQFIPNGAMMHHPHQPQFYEQFLRLPPPPHAAAQAASTAASHYTHLPPMQPSATIGNNGTANPSAIAAAQAAAAAAMAQGANGHGLPPLAPANSAAQQGQQQQQGQGQVPILPAGMTYGQIPLHQQQQFYYPYGAMAPQFQQMPTQGQMQFMHAPNGSAAQNQQPTWNSDFHFG